MAYYSIFPEKDTTLYSHPDRLEMNTGNDELLELVKEKGSSDASYYPSRILIKFKDEDISDIFKIAKIKTSTLQLFSTQHENLASNHIIEAFPLSQSWDEGTGKYPNLPQSLNGGSWKYTNNSNSPIGWSDSFNDNSTGSIDSEVISHGGGSWYTSRPGRISILYKATQSFSNASSLDLNLDISKAIMDIQSGHIPNHGFILKNKNLVETFTSSSRGTLSYFSADTHTIYPPKLTFKWDDSKHNSQSLAKTNGNLNVSLYRNKGEYNQNDEALIRLHVRDKYPTRQFTSTSNYINPGYFTTSSFYSIRDAHTEEEIIPFDESFTKLSADDEGMYFKLYMKGLQPERYYRLLFKHVNNDGTEVFDNNYNFKVIR
jgi:hypothetical protein